jgi:hypothetical protein
MFLRFQHTMRPILHLCTCVKLNKEFFLDSAIFTTTTGAVIGSSVGLYNGVQLSKYHVSITDKLKITLGGCLNGILQGLGCGCYLCIRYI